MLQQARQYVRRNAVAFLALFVALGGTGAYAANTIGSSDVIDESLQSVDIKNGQIRSADIADYSVELRDLEADSVKGSRVIDDTLTGDDILESSLGKVPNAATLSGRTASGIVRAENASASNIAWPGDTLSQVGAVDVTAPHAGYLLLQGGVVAKYPNGCAECFVYLRFTDFYGSVSTTVKVASLRSAGKGVEYVPLEHSALMKVGKGTHELQMEAIATGGGDVGSNYSFTAMYIPFNGAGGID